MKPIDLGGDSAASSPEDLAAATLAASDKQVAAKGIEDVEARSDFLISTDALNYWRMVYRCMLEWGQQAIDPEIDLKLRAAICSYRGYDPEEFDLATHATVNRVRMPFGWTALEYARKMSELEPIWLLPLHLHGRKVATLIAGIARQLQIMQGDEPILLPIDQLRELLGLRKIVVSGAVQMLVEAGVIEYASKAYHTGKAREFRFVGVEGQHFSRSSTE